MDHDNPSLPWTVVVTALILATAFAALNIFYGWTMLDAFVVVGLGSLSLTALILAAVATLLGKDEQRHQLRKSFTDTVIRDWNAFVRYFSR